MRAKTLRLFLTALALVSLTMGVSTAFAAPVNDSRANATLITVLPFHDNQNLIAVGPPMARDPADPSPSCVFQPYRTVWYKFNGNDNWMEANTSGSNYNTFIAVYREANGTLTEVACNDNRWSWSWDAEVPFFAQAGQVYYIMVGSLNNRTYGHLDFCVDIQTDLPCT